MAWNHARRTNATFARFIGRDEIIRRQTAIVMSPVAKRPGCIVVRLWPFAITPDHGQLDHERFRRPGL
jgi:hypothetical protein